MGYVNKILFFQSILKILILKYQYWNMYIYLGLSLLPCILFHLANIDKNEYMLMLNASRISRIIINIQFHWIFILPLNIFMGAFFLFTK